MFIVLSKLILLLLTVKVRNVRSSIKVFNVRNYAKDYKNEFFVEFGLNLNIQN